MRKSCGFTIQMKPLSENFHILLFIYEDFSKTVRIISLVTVLFRRVKASEVGYAKSKTRAEGIQNTVIVLNKMSIK